MFIMSKMRSLENRFRKVKKKDLTNFFLQLIALFRPLNKKYLLKHGYIFKLIIYFGL